jgi:hypothetical protein
MNGEAFLNRIAVAAFTLGALLSAGAVHAQEKPKPCSEDPIYRQQDFTLGAWDVYTGDHKTAEVSFERSLKDCAIRETWKAAGPSGDGLGLFTYSRLLKAWHYLWIADTGATTYLKGGAVGPGEMKYLTVAPLANGGERLRTWTLTARPDGSVQELSVGTEDGGKTSIKEYELIWRKKP